MITRLNQEREYNYLPIPTGTIRKTSELFDGQRNHVARVNYSVKNCKPIQNPDNTLLVEPYMLGLWLGDGHSRGGKICMLNIDFEEIIQTSKERVAATKLIYER